MVYVQPSRSREVLSWLKADPDHHYDFLAECTPAGDAVVPVCPTDAPRAETHQAAIDEAIALFGEALGGG